MIIRWRDKGGRGDGGCEGVGKGVGEGREYIINNSFDKSIVGSCEGS